MKNYFKLLFILTFCASCVNLKTYSKQFLPKEVSETTYFNMSLPQFIHRKGDVVKFQKEGNDFRKVYLEKIEDSTIDYVVYYFDADNHQPLYEVIIVYHTEVQRDKAAQRLFGTPNHQGKEWRIERKSHPHIWAWKYEKKLIVTALIPETEWYEEIR